MTTSVTYNDITIYNTLTKRFDQEPVYDESHTDLLYYKFTIGIVGYVHGIGTGTNSDGNPVPWPATNSPFSWNLIAPPSGTSFSGGGASLQERAIRYALGTPRGPFTMFTNSTIDPISGVVRNGDPLLTCFPATAFGRQASFNASGVDLNNGPKPTALRVMSISGDAIFRVEFEIEICKMECDSEGNCLNDSGVLSNRWTMTDDIDNNFYTTRTLQGVLKTITARLNPQSFRAFVVPPLGSGFRRSHMTFIASADGLSLNYTVVDTEIAFSAPPPATTWKLSHSEMTGSGIISNSEVFVMLGGPRGVNKKLLIAIACQIIEAKALRWNRIGPKGVNFIITNLTLTDVYGDSENYIEARASVTHIPLKIGAAADPKWELLVGAGKVLGAPLTSAQIDGYNNSRSINPDTLNPEGVPGGPISIVNAFSAFLQSPCSTIHGVASIANPADANFPR